MTSEQDARSLQANPRALEEPNSVAEQEPDQRAPQADIFSGLTFYIQARDENNADLSRGYKKLARIHGANVILSFSPSADVVIADAGQTRLIEKAHTMGSLVVRPQWFEDCVNQKALLSVTEYTIPIKLKNEQIYSAMASDLSKRRNQCKGRGASSFNPELRSTRNYSKQHAEHRAPPRAKGADSVRYPAYEKNSPTRNESDHLALNRCMKPRQVTFLDQSHKRESIFFTLFEDNQSSRAFCVTARDSTLLSKGCENSNTNINTQATFKTESTKPKLFIKGSSSRKKSAAPLPEIAIPKRRYTLDVVDHKDPLRYISYIQKKVKRALK